MGFNCNVDKRPVNTLQYMLDNSKIGDSVLVYEDGDQQICDLPKRLLKKDGSVKVKNGLMLFDTEENKIIAKTPQEVYEFCDDCLIFDTEMNCTEKQKMQVLNWFEKYGVQTNLQEIMEG